MLMFYMLRHVTILSVAACITGSMIFGTTVLAPMLLPHVWFAYSWWVQVVSMMLALYGIGLTVWAGLQIPLKGDGDLSTSSAQCK